MRERDSGPGRGGRGFALSGPDALARFNKAMTELTSRRLLGGGPLEPRVRGFTEVVAEALEVTRASLWLKDPSKGTLGCVDLYDRRTGRHESGASIAAGDFPAYFHALDDERNIAASDAHRDPRTRELSPPYLVPLGIRSILDVPLRRDGATIGVLCVEETGGTREWVVEEELFAVTAANLLNLALESDERRKAEEALELARDRAEDASRAKTRFLGAMSHELRTPLNAIIGYADLLAEETSSAGGERLHADAHRIRTAGQRLLVLVEEALNLSDLDAGRLSVRSVPVDVAGLVAEAAEEARPLLSGRPIGLEVSIGATERVSADPARLRQVLASLLDNAAKFTREGQIRVGALPVERDGRRWVEISVADTGCGLPRGLQAELFTPFSPGDDPGSRPFAGHGVGLAIARRLCTLMGGAIEVASEPGAGATFTVRFPALAAPA